jgi:2-amino-4-hydroxy-6-hydroxymethyldihydropteridine diphosphokinase
VTRAYLSIGSNIEREPNLRRCVRTLHELFRPLELSSVYRTRAIGFEGDDFYNMVVSFDTDLPVEALKARIREIEDAQGRVRRTEKFTARPLDIDLLLYGDMIRRKGLVDLPRPEILKHAFVLQPLCEIAPGLRHPETGRCIADIWDQFDASGQPTRRIDFDFDLVLE